VLSWAASTGDPDFGLFPLYHSHSMGAIGNRSFYENREVDRLLELAREEINPQRRLEIYAEAQRLIFEDTVKIYVRRVEALVGASNNLRGLRLFPHERHSIASIYFVD